MQEEAIGRLSIRELIVDFLGSLVPGLIFVSCVLVMVAWPLSSAFQVVMEMLRAPRSIDEIHKSFAQIAASIRVELTVLLVMLAYVAGHLFYRQDPKEPDSRSFNVSVKDTKDWVADHGECEFPYIHFDRYLRSRNLTHLLSLTEWCDPEKRTKNFLNILKIRLFFEHGDKCGSIAKNEAHVRLMSSTWYMSRALQWLAAGIVLFSLVTAFVSGVSLRFGWGVVLYLIPATPAVVVFTFATLSKHIIERFLHYQRVREVIWVLETAYVAYRDRPELLQDICPRFGKAQA